MALSRGSDGSFQLSRGGCNAEGGHVFAGLEGLATTLVLRPQSRFTREPSLALQPRGDHETAKSLPATRPGRTPSSPMLQRSQTSLRQQPQTLKEKSELLKNISVHGPTFTLIHDLYTPNRSYIFGETTNSGRRAAAEYEKEAADQLRQRRIWSYEDKIEKHKQRIGEVHRSGFVRTKKALPTKSSTPISRQLDGIAFPAEPSAESSMLALLGLAEDGVPNELIGPFRNESSEVPMLPAVKQVSTFEDYLERMMKQVRAGPVRFDKRWAFVALKNSQQGSHCVRELQEHSAHDRMHPQPCPDAARKR